MAAKRHKKHKNKVKKILNSISYEEYKSKSRLSTKHQIFVIIAISSYSTT